MSWKSVALGDVVKLQNGYAFKSSEYAEIGYFLMRITNVQQGFISNHNPKYVSIPNDSKLVQFIVNEGDILMSLTGDVGRVGVVKSENLPAALNQRVARIQIKSRELLDENFLFYLLNSDSFREKIEELGHGAAQLNVATSDIAKLLIPLPSLATQQKIVEKLEAIFAEIDRANVATEANLKNAEALFQSYLTKVFERGGDGWLVENIGNICTLRSGTTVDVKLEKPVGELPYLKVADMNLDVNKKSITSSSRFLDLSDVGAKSIIRKGSTIFPKRGGAIDTNKKRITDVDIAIDLNLMSVFPSEKLNSQLLYFYFLSLDMKKLGSGSSIRQINNYDIEPLEINFPKNMEEQTDIVNKITNLYSSCECLKISFLDKLENLAFMKQSVLKQAFNGEFVKE